MTAPARVKRAATAASGSSRAEGSWTAQQIVLHLLAVETDVFQARLFDLAESTSPEWSWVEPGPAEMGPAETLDDSILRFAGARLATLDWVAALDDDGWARTGRHATLGPLSVAGLLALAADHDAEHLATLTRMARSRG